MAIFLLGFYYGNQQLFLFKMFGDLSFVLCNLHIVFVNGQSPEAVFELLWLVFCGVVCVLRGDVCDGGGMCGVWSLVVL